MAIKNIDLWVKSAVESFFETHSDPITKSFLIEYLDYSSQEKDWVNLPQAAKMKLVGKELGRLQNKKKIRQTSPDEIIHRSKIYLAC